MARLDCTSILTFVLFFFGGLYVGDHLRGDGLQRTIALENGAEVDAPRAAQAAGAWPSVFAPEASLPAHAAAPADGVGASLPYASQGGSAALASGGGARYAEGDPARGGAQHAAYGAAGGAAAGRRGAPARGGNSAHGGASTQRRGGGMNASTVNRFAGLERHFERLPIAPHLLEHEREPPTTAAQISANVSSQPLLPEVFVPCCAKTGTTFLWGCTAAAFAPTQVCGSPRSERWSKQWCGAKKYVLPGYRILESGCRIVRKEYFFWGGGKNEDGRHFPSRGLLWYAGRPAPLETWEPSHRMCYPPSAVKRMCYEDLPDIDYSRILRRRNRIEIVPADQRMHPACTQLRLRGRPMGTFTPAFRLSLELESSLPWVDRRVHPGALSMDFTPNHMFDHVTPIRLWHYMPHPERLKFIVTLRNPLKRAYSEWSMFVKWNWEKVHNFGAKLEIELAGLRRCNATIFQTPSLLLTLPHEQFSAYHAKCFSGQAMEYVRNSMYIIGFRNFMRVFEARQFLVIWSEDMMVVPPETLLAEFGAFTGLTLNPSALGNPLVQAKCRTAHDAAARKNHQSFAKGMSAQEEELLRHIFAPYDEMLDLWLKHYGVKVALQDHPNVVRRRRLLAAGSAPLR